MAVEFDIKIKNPVSQESLVDRVSELLKGFGVEEPLVTDGAFDGKWGDDERFGTLRVGDTIATLMAHKAGEEADLGEEGGFWVTVSADRSRDGSGVFLTAVVAIAVAQEAGSCITDEVDLLRSAGREVDPEDALRGLEERVGRGRLAEIGGRFFDSINRTWGSTHRWRL